MKKTFVIAFAAASLMLGSCSTISNTAATQGVDTELHNRSTADVVVSPKRVSYTLTPNSEQHRAGLKSMKAAAIEGALEANGGGDFLVAPQYEIKKKRGFFKTTVKYIKVSGHVATYTNVHPTTKTEAEVIDILK